MKCGRPGFKKKARDRNVFLIKVWRDHAKTQCAQHVSDGDTGSLRANRTLKRKEKVEN